MSSWHLVLHSQLNSSRRHEHSCSIGNSRIPVYVTQRMKVEDDWELRLKRVGTTLID